jgi:hypothetical protein
MTKKVTINWTPVASADGYFMYFSELSNPLEFIGVSTDPFTIIQNRANDAVVNFAVQPFKLKTINGIDRRVPGNAASIQIDVATVSSQKFKKTKITSFSIQDQ